MLALTSAVEFMVALDVLVVTTALAAIRGSVHATLASLEWTVTGYTVCLAGFMMTGAALGDRFGRRRMLCIGVAVFTAGSALCALAPSVGVLIAGRVAQGVGAALLAPLSLPLISAVYPPEHRGRALGVVAGVTGLATFAGPLLGGGIAQALGWQWIFWVNVPVGLVLMLLIRARVPESHGPERGVDLPGVLLATASLLAVSWGLVRAANVGWSAPDVIGGLALGIVLAVAFLRAERGAARPMLDVALLRSRTLAAANVVAFLHSAVVLGAVFVMAQFLQAELGVGSFGAGMRLLPWTGSMMLVAPIAGLLADHLGLRTVIVGALGMSGAGCAWLAVLCVPHVGYASLVGPLVVIGVGNSGAFPALSSAVAAGVAPDDLGPASGVNNAVREIGGVLGVAAVTLVFTAAGSFADATAAAVGFRAVAVLCAGLAALGAIAGFFIPVPATSQRREAKAAIATSGP